MIGETFSHYRILERLGDAGFPGPLYRAEELKSRSQVALRVLPSSFGREERKRLMRIAAAASKLGHPNIESLLEVGETEDGQLFYCGKLPAGNTLDRWIECEALAPGDALDVIAQIARGLARAHRAGIVHGALRPDVVELLDGHQVTILGFGFAVLAGEGLSVRSGDPVGALAYRSPEQIRGGRPHPRFDVWSLGVILYEMLTGRRPFQGSTAGSLAESILGSPPPPLAKTWKSAPADCRVPELDRVLTRALSKETDKRYSGVAEFIRELVPFGSTLGEPQWSTRVAEIADAIAKKSAEEARRKKTAVEKAAREEAPTEETAAAVPEKKAAPRKKVAPKKKAASKKKATPKEKAAEPAIAEDVPAATVPGAPPPALADRPQIPWALLGGGLILLLAVLAWLLGGF